MSSESAVLGYVGAGLVAFGAVALGSRRKFFQGAPKDTHTRTPPPQLRRKERQ